MSEPQRSWTALKFQLMCGCFQEPSKTRPLTANGRRRQASNNGEQEEQHRIQDLTHPLSGGAGKVEALRCGRVGTPKAFRAGVGPRWCQIHQVPMGSRCDTLRSMSALGASRIWARYIVYSNHCCSNQSLTGFTSGLFAKGTRSSENDLIRFGYCTCSKSLGCLSDKLLLYLALIMWVPRVFMLQLLIISGMLPIHYCIYPTNQYIYIYV